MITKLFIIFIMIIIAGSLASGLFFLVRDTGDSKRTGVSSNWTGNAASGRFRSG
jgi:hypothetical protein